MSVLDNLLAKIGPERTLDATAAEADRALNSFSLSQSVIDRWADYTKCMAQFHFHVTNCVCHVRTGRDLDLKTEWGYCIHILMDEYGREGEKVGFEMARTGVQGGLRAVLRAVAKRMAEQYAQNEINTRIRFCLRDMTIDEQFAAQKEYLEKYGQLLPAEMTEGSAVRIVANFERILQLHPKLMRGLGRIGRNRP